MNNYNTYVFHLIWIQCQSVVHVYVYYLSTSRSYSYYVGAERVRIGTGQELLHCPEKGAGKQKNDARYTRWM
ncbi:hypothetical protein PLICRDRAFT_352637 [Plicaturopsis crispa FD-325 SS-3]|uniref:Uncharacterized protein n=1 Tax=Plicaturopsis crispa FD-325 SS-3 TaxID=944288 RepID=A0A0C9SRC6_PLICR|nr:hypothetical protein PLICRDRAFT_352637 [Plicaturopsis crispa FD-325 SS-3]